MRKALVEPIKNMLGLKDTEEIPANLESFLTEVETMKDRMTQGVIRDSELLLLVAAYKLQVAAQGGVKKKAGE